MNETRIGYNRFAQNYPESPVTFPGLDRFPNITPEDLGINIGPTPGAPQFTFQNTYQLVDNLSWFTNPHSFKFGFEGRRAILPQHVIQRERGDYSYSRLERFLHDEVPDNLAQRNLGTTQYYGNNWSTNLYGHDDFHIRRNMTLNIGLRWERTTVPQTMKLQALNAISSVPGSSSSVSRRRATGTSLLVSVSHIHRATAVRHRFVQDSAWRTTSFTITSVPRRIRRS